MLLLRVIVRRCVVVRRCVARLSVVCRSPLSCCPFCVLSYGVRGNKEKAPLYIRHK